MPIAINVLQVKHGDAFVIECQQGDNKGVIVVDGGPQSTHNVYRRALDKYPAIDLLVLTHYDEDHIGGILSYFRACKSNGRPLKIKEIWANCASSIDFDDNTDLSVGQAKKLSDMLHEYVERGALVWRNTICEGVKVDFGFARIEVISPTRDILAQAVAKIPKEETNEDLNLAARSRQTEDLGKSLEELAQTEKNAPDLNNPGQLANASSIAFILECDGTTVLMLGDSYPQTIVDYLTNKDTDRVLPIMIDYMKVSHHGSRNNTSNDLLDLIDCQNFIFSTNGGKGNTSHPDRETIANIVCHPKRDKSKKINLFFNYSKPIIETNGHKFINDDEPQRYSFEVHDNTTLL